jgi:hypothetical protein
MAQSAGGLGVGGSNPLAPTISANDCRTLGGDDLAACVCASDEQQRRNANNGDQVPARIPAPGSSPVRLPSRPLNTGIPTVAGLGAMGVVNG